MTTAMAVLTDMTMTMLTSSVGAPFSRAAQLATMIVLWLVTSSLPAEELPPHPLEWTNSLGMRLSYVPAGKFLMGSPAAEPGRQEREHQREVHITRPVYIGVTEVMQAEYQELMEQNPSLFGQRERATKDSSAAEFELHPVERVTWRQAISFCEKLTERESRAVPRRIYRLPTEAEWEYACRAGKTTSWCFGDDPKQLSDHAWFGKRDAERHTYPVAKKQPNAWGLHDMHGNVWEWCSDWYASDYGLDAPQADPMGPEAGISKVIRGGAYLSPAANTRSATRFHDPPQIVDEDIGFRVVLEITPDKEKARRPTVRDARPE